MSTPSAATKTGVVLDRPSDWDEWFSVVQRAAQDANIFKLVDPKLDAQPELLTKPTEPSAATIKAGATSVTALNPEELNKYKVLREEYRSKLSEYKDQSKALQELSKLIVDTVSRSNYTFIQDDKTSWEILRTLKKRLSPTTRARQHELVRQYNELKKAPWSQNIEKWLQTWERVYKQCMSQELPDVTGDRPIFDFLTAIRGVDSSYADAQEVHVIDKIESGHTPTIFDIIEKYRDHQRMIKSTTKSASHTAFATFQGEQQPDESRQPQKQKDYSNRPCLCGETHEFKTCAYLVEKLRSPKWSPDPRIQGRIEGILERSARLRQTIDRLNNPAPEQSKEQSKAQKKKTATPVQPSELSSTPSAYVVGREDYKLLNCWTLDCASDVHVCNDPSRFTVERVATEDDTLYAGANICQIAAFGTVHINVDTPTGKSKIQLLNVALVPTFFTSLVSLRRMNKKGVDWDMRNNRLMYGDNTVCYVDSVDDHWVLEKNAPSSSAYATSSAPRAALKASPEKWHAILGHPNQQAVAHLESAAAGAKVDSTSTSAGSCVTCHLSKAHHVVSRRPDKEDPASEPLTRISYDLVEFAPAYNGDKWMSHFRCYYTSMDWVYTHAKKSQAVDVIKEFVNMVHTRYSKSIRYFRTDGERSLGRSFDDFMASQGITPERSAPGTPAQNGGAERAGGVIVLKARCIRIASTLPASMWPEIVKAAGYLSNRTPKRQLEWKTPIEALTGQPPNLAHLHVYGCRAYPLNKKIPHRQKLEPRAHIGHLVGYDSSNIYRIWIPSQNKVIRTRDVSFDESLFYDPSELDLGHILHEDVENAVEVIQQPPSLLKEPTTTEELEDDLQDDLFSAGPTANSKDTESSAGALSEPDSGAKTTHDQLLTPADTPVPDSVSSDTPADALESSDAAQVTHQQVLSTFTEQNILPKGEKRSRKKSRKAAYAAALADTSNLNAFHGAFAAGLNLGGAERRIHRDALPPEPKSWKQVLKHRYAAEFKKAAQKEIEDLERRGTFKHVAVNEARAATVLPLIWVFKYKFDSDGYLEKFKARICVRGDLQKTEQDTYAATLAARTFRALLAIAAVFDLEVLHYDAVNAFVNFELNEKIYCRLPDGFEREGLCWLLLRALYGLKQSPLLWYMVFTAALEELGLSEVPGVNCLFSNGWLTLFFYVDDIVILCAPQNLHKLRQFEEALLSRFEMRSLGELKWFLGIRIVRDRANRRIWLCQDSYIEKVASRFHIAESKTAPKTPLPSTELLPADEQATAQQILAYQQRVGSIGFAAAVSRPDISFAVSKLSRFLKNPSPKHLDAADRVISYLLHTRSLAIEYSPRQEGEIFMCASDAAFADDPETRKSSDGYLFQLYGGPIDWRAAKQSTVTTSSTEAELLSLSTASKELIWWGRFFDGIQFKMEQKLTISCDNTQTIGAMEKESLRLSTKLRHIDIHQHWLRQEVENGRVTLKWIPTAEMPADGLTKALPAQKNETFVEQLNLVDIQERLDLLG